MVVVDNIVVIVDDVLINADCMLKRSGVIEYER